VPDLDDVPGQVQSAWLRFTEPLRGVVPFCGLYPQSPQHVEGVAYKAGKSDTPDFLRGIAFIAFIWNGFEKRRAGCKRVQSVQ